MRRIPAQWIRVLGLVWLSCSDQALAATLTGRITRTGGAGVHPCDIDVWNDQGDPVVLVGDTTTTNGNYSLTLPPGRYDVRFQPAMGSHLFDELRKGVQVTTTTTLDRTLSDASYLTGRVVDSAGHGVANVNLDFRSPETGEQAGNQQDDQTLTDGTFLALVDPGIWDVEILAPIAMRLVPGRVEAVNLLADASLPDHPLASGHIATITVIDQGFFPVADADLDVRPATGGPELFTPKDNTDAAGFLQLVLPSGTYDFTATPPPATALASRTARQVVVTSDVAVPDLDLPPGVLLSARSVGPTLAPVAGVDCDVDSLPLLRRLEVAGDASSASGTYNMRVPAHDYRVTFIPPVATRLLPVRYATVNVPAATNLGDVVHQQGHWVDVQVVSQGTGLPVVGANIDLIRESNTQPLITADDVTGPAGSARVVTDTDLFLLRVIPPSGAFDTLEVTGFRTLGDTTITLVLPTSTLAVDAASAGSLALAAPWPNPARGGCQIGFVTPRDTFVRLDAWDVHGRRVATLFEGRVNGQASVRWDGRTDHGRALLAGSFWLRLQDGSSSVTRRVTLLP